ncbi:MAG: ATP-binding protein [Chitinophagales bacterium]
MTKPLPVLSATMPRRIISRLGVRGKLLLLVLIVLVPLLTLQLGGIVARFERRTQEELVASGELAQASGAAFQGFLSRLWDTEAAIGNAITAGLPEDQIQAFLQRQLPTNPAIDNFSWVSPQGIVLEATDSASKGINCADREHIRRIAAGAEEAVSGLLETRTDHQLTFFAARGIRREGKLLGIVAARVRPDALGAVLKVERRGGANVVLFDHTGHVVYRSNSPRMSLAQRMLAPESPAWHVLREKHSIVFRNRVSSFDGKPRMGATVPVPVVGWAISATAPVDQVLAGAWADARQDAFILILVATFSLLSALVLADTLVRPVASLKGAAQGLSQGDLSVRVNLPGHDELATAAQAFDQMASRIEELQSARARFLQVAAHELRNPMAVVKGACSLLRLQLTGQKLDPAAMVEDLRLLEGEVDRLSNLLNEIQEAFRLEQGQLELRRQPVDLSEVIEQALRPFRAFDQGHRYVVAKPLPKAVVMGDPRRLEDVLRNLVGNAGKYSPEGGEVKVALAVEQGWAKLSVHDQGFGIPEAELPRVFESFYRASNLQGRDPEGMGLGLYICRNIVEQHGGRISVESAEGQGSTFHVELPLEESETLPPDRLGSLQ